MRQRLIFLIALAIGASSIALGDERVDRLPEELRVWLEEEVVYLITDVERETFLDLETEEEYRAFIEAFWRKRDTNPTTLENEFQIEHYERLAYVNEFFGRDTFRDGWMTDQGRYYILLGPPTERQIYEGYDIIYPAQLWFYNDPKYKQYGLPPFFYLLFFRRGGFGELELYHPLSDEPQDLLSGYQSVGNIFREDVERAYNQIYENVSPELAHATLSFRTDEGDRAQFQAPAFGTISLLDDIEKVPIRGVDTSYAERFDVDKGTVESDYLFSYVPSFGMASVLAGPGNAHYLHWILEVDPQNVALVRDPDRGLYGTVFILSIEVVSRDNPNVRVIDARKESYMNFPEARIESVLTRPFSYSGMTPIAPGGYDVRVLWRNRACTGRDDSSCRKSYTILEAAVDVPRWTEGSPHLSELVLGYGIERDDQKPVYRPYRFGSLEFLPNPRRVYAIGDALYVLVDTLDIEPEHEVRFRVLRRDPDDVTTQLTQTVPAPSFGPEPLVQQIALGDASGGNYELVVDLLDAAGNVLQTRRESFVVTPRTAIVRPGVRGSWSEVSPEIPGLVEMALGAQYVNLDERALAQELLEASVAKNPRLPPAREALAGLLLKQGKAENALELLAPIRQHMPDRYEMLVLVGEARFLQENYADSREAFSKAASARRLEPRLVRLLALSHVELGELGEAVAVLESALAGSPGHPVLEPLLEELQARPD